VTHGYCTRTLQGAHGARRASLHEIAATIRDVRASDEVYTAVQAFGSPPPMRRRGVPPGWAARAATTQVRESYHAFPSTPTAARRGERSSGRSASAARIRGAFLSGLLARGRALRDPLGIARMHG